MTKIKVIVTATATPSAIAAILFFGSELSSSSSVIDGISARPFGDKGGGSEGGGGDG